MSKAISLENLQVFKEECDNKYALKSDIPRTDELLGTRLKANATKQGESSGGGETTGSVYTRGWRLLVSPGGVSVTIRYWTSDKRISDSESFEATFTNSQTFENVVAFEITNPRTGDMYPTYSSFEANQPLYIVNDELKIGYSADSSTSRKRVYLFSDLKVEIYISGGPV